ncbi:MAG: M48 family metallopeptidase [Thermoflavifilum sp.]|nr:M48 family metallopeptidase [Thermoflavifilum sp.]
MMGILVILAIGLIESCSQVPITGRTQLHLVPESSLDQMALTEYRSFLSQNKVVPASSPQAEMVQRVGERLAKAITLYLTQHGYGDRVANYHWEFHLVDNKEANAWCMPGGKVVVYTGILPYTRDENGLAVVMGHEIAHAIAQHGAERMSEQLLQQAGGQALAIFMQEKPQATRDAFLQAYDIGTTVGAVLPHSRKQESEADHLGLIFMALAGYDPHAALDFWQRMSQAGTAQIPTFLSDHPSDAQRIANIKKWIPEAMKYYHQRP